MTVADPNVGTPPVAVEHLGWEALVSARREAHKATNALIAAAHIADRTISVMSDQGRWLPDVFPGDEPIFEHFNFRLREARPLLREARGSFGAIVLPYAVALYNDYLIDAVALVVLAGVSPPDQDRVPGLSALHAFLRNNCNINLDVKPQMRMFEVVREMRNCVVHGSQIADNGLADAREALRTDAADAERDWQNVTKHPLPMFKNGDVIALRPLDARGAIYAAANLARELNHELFQWLPKDLVADLVVAHYRYVRAGKDWGHQRRSSQIPKFRTAHYGTVALTAASLENAISRSPGKWPSALSTTLESLEESARKTGSKASQRRLACARLLFRAAPSLPVQPG